MKGNTMSKAQTRMLALVAALMLTCGLASDALASAPQSFADAKKLAESEGRPLLLKVGTSWCKSCKKFDQTVESEADFRSTITDNAVLYTVDAEKGEGIDVARAYQVAGYPTFVLMNSDGEMMDCWMGFHKSEGFVESMEKALADPTTVADKLERFRENPTSADALKLGDLRQYQGMSAEAVAYYQRAQELDGDADIDYDLRIFGAMARGSWGQLYSTGDVVQQADAVFASSPEPSAMLEVLYSMKKISHKTEQPTLWHPYLKATVEAADGITDEKFAKKVAWHKPDYALHIEKDVEKAIQYRKDVMPEDWLQDANQLNNYAWWCFENNVNLEEADTMARRGIELAESGKEKANILDTLAEICNARDDCANAVEYIRMAVAEAPEEEYFQKQLVRFEEALLAQAD
jgi:thioredoxin-related protein